jgi:hypothetical protein
MLDMATIPMAAFHEFPDQAERVIRGGRGLGPHHLEQ